VGSAVGTLAIVLQKCAAISEVAGNFKSLASTSSATSAFAFSKRASLKMNRLSDLPPLLPALAGQWPSANQAGQRRHRIGLVAVILSKISMT